MRPILTGLILVSMNGYAADDYERQQIEQRIAPIGQVRIQGETTAPAVAQPVQPAPAETAKKEPGQEIYEKYCQTCHRDGVAGAPKFRAEAEWKSRLAKGIDGLTTSAIKGLNAMPPKGTCSECTDADIKAAVEYMVPKS
ncbi:MULTISPECIES: c-type cytochrome [Legionella]|nr:MULTISPECIES: c-type cytochrome [Legionella]MCP0913904.1 c-type cytochrome [Legionella sp. 27cVA30]